MATENTHCGLRRSWIVAVLAGALLGATIPAVAPADQVPVTIKGKVYKSNGEVVKINCLADEGNEIMAAPGQRFVVFDPSCLLAIDGDDKFHEIQFYGSEYDVIVNGVAKSSVFSGIELGVSPPKGAMHSEAKYAAGIISTEKGRLTYYNEDNEIIFIGTFKAKH